jgi:hypothetical protein
LISAVPTAPASTGPSIRRAPAPGIGVKIGQSGRVPAPSIEPNIYDAFVSQMHLLVHEEAGLWEAPWESTVVGRDFTERRGPWPPEACSWVLLRWFEAGLLGLYQCRPGDDELRDLAADEGRAALIAVEAWAPSIGVFLFATEAGEAAPFEVWAGIAA